MSPPRLPPDAAASISALASSNPASSKSFFSSPPRRPARTTLAYPATPSTRLPSSGKCRPYHSRMRRSRRFAILSTSSSDLTACMMCMSALPDASATLEADSASAKSRRRETASAWSDAKPDSTRMAGFDACAASASPASIARHSIPAAPLRATSSPASLTAAAAPGPRPDRYSARPDRPSSLPSLAARYSAGASANGNERACESPSYTATPSSVRITLCTAIRAGRPLKVYEAAPAGAGCVPRRPEGPAPRIPPDSAGASRREAGADIPGVRQEAGGGAGRPPGRGRGGEEAGAAPEKETRRFSAAGRTALRSPPRDLRGGRPACASRPGRSALPIILWARRPPGLAARAGSLPRQGRRAGRSFGGRNGIGAPLARRGRRWIGGGLRARIGRMGQCPCFGPLHIGD